MSAVGAAREEQAVSYLDYGQPSVTLPLAEVERLRDKGKGELMETEQQTTSEQRVAARERAWRRDDKGFEYTTVKVGDLVALCDDADALAVALAEVERLRRAIGEIGASIGFAADVAEDEIGGDSRTGRTLERIGEMTLRYAQNRARMPVEAREGARSGNGSV